MFSFLVWIAVNAKHGIIGPYFSEKIVEHKRIGDRLETVTVTSEMYQEWMRCFRTDLELRVGIEHMDEQIFMQVS